MTKIYKRTPMLVVSNLSRTFGDRVAVDGVSFNVRPGEILALLGPNGAGKTTTLRMVAGLIRPSTGTILIDGVPLDARTAGGLRARIGLLTEVPGLWDRLSLWDNLVTYARLYGLADPDAATARWLDEFGLLGRRHEPAALLSKGMRQKLALARALVHDPRLVLLDEPTAGLDPQMASGVRTRIARMREEGRAIVLSTHNLEEADRLADRVAVLAGRLLALDTPAALRGRLFGRRVRVRLLQRAAPFAAVAAEAGAGDIQLEATTLSFTADDLDRATPAVVRALVAAGALVRAVEEERVPLEAAYLRLIAAARPTRPRPGGDDAAGAPSGEPGGDAGGAAASGGVPEPAPSATTALLRRGAEATSPAPRVTPPSAATDAVLSDAPLTSPAATPRRTRPRPLDWTRLGALLRKEARDVRANPGVLLPLVAMTALMVLPFLIALVVPRLAGTTLAQDADLRRAIDALGASAPVLRRLPPEAAAQAFVFQQFLLVLVLVPVVGGMALASHSVIGEKHARTLEPLLETPATTVELLVAKALAAALPALLAEGGIFVAYLAAVAGFAAPGVAGALLSTRTGLLVGLVGPLAALVGLELAVLVSSRVGDPRTAQQAGIFVILPFVALFVAEVAGLFWSTPLVLVLAATGLAALWVGLLAASVALFDRETILTRWK